MVKYSDMSPEDAKKNVVHDRNFLQFVLSNLHESFARLTPVFSLPPDIFATAAVLIHRLYLVSTFEENDVGLYTSAAAHLAMLTHDAYVHPEDFLRHWTAVNPAAPTIPLPALLHAEGALARAVGFDLTIWGPYKTFFSLLQLIADACVEDSRSGGRGPLRGLLPPAAEHPFAVLAKRVTTESGPNLLQTELDAAMQTIKRCLLVGDGLPVMAVSPHALAAAILRVVLGAPWDAAKAHQPAHPWDPDSVDGAEWVVRNINLGKRDDKESAVRAVFARKAQANIGSDAGM